MNISNIHNFPQALVEAVKNDPYTGGGDISITKLIDSPQRRILLKQYKESIVEDVSERIFSLLGQAVHTILERQDQGKSVIVEDRLYTKILDWDVSGQYDRMDLRDGVLDDYKVTGVYKAMMNDHIEWERQLNCLRYLAHMNGYEIKQLRIVAILRDWRKADVGRKEGYPEAAAQIIDIPVWDLWETKQYMESRVKAHMEAEASNPEYMTCSSEERWYQGTTYALMKDGGKRAIKIFERKEDAEAKLVDGCHVEERLGVNRRCADYCEVSQFCEQYRPYRESNDAPFWPDSSSS